MLFHLTERSTNIKTGPIPVTISSAHTCPDCCPLKGQGCYAETGPLAIHWKRVTNSVRGISFKELCEKIRLLPAGFLWRHNQAGDLVGDKETIDTKSLKALTKANKGKRGFTYTHYDVINNRVNRKAVKQANANGFTINLSANNISHADKLVKCECGPVVVTLESGDKKTITTPDENKVIVCPATYKGQVNCANCGLCAKVNRKTIVGFPVHGTRKAVAAKAIVESI